MSEYPKTWLQVAHDRGVQVKDNGRINGQAFADVGISIINGCAGGCQATVAPHSSYQIAEDDPYVYCRNCTEGIMEIQDE